MFILGCVAGGGEVLPTPTFSGYTTGSTPGRYKYNITISNYDATYGYTISSSVGTPSRTGNLITVNGSADTQSITLYVTATKLGYNNSIQASTTNSTPAAPCAFGTYLYTITYPTAGGVPDGCTYYGICDGNYGIGLQWVGGPCAYPDDYCAGCT